MWNVSGLEAVYRDYQSKGVKFFFVYKALAHPELAGNYVQPFTLEERLAHARQAEAQLGASIPWLVDAMDNRLKHALGDRANSEFILDPKGIVVRKRAWSHPAQVRTDLEELVGPVERVTKEDDIVLKTQLPIKAPAARGIIPRIQRSEMQGILVKPVIDPQGEKFFAKLRAEVNPSVLRNGSGQLYLGFHLDPFHGAHWNNLTQPLSYKLEVPGGVKIDKLSGEAARLEVASDADPREFLFDVQNWSSAEPIRVTVHYFACVGETSCHEVRQQYEIFLRRDRDAGKARGEGAGYWDPVGFARQMFDRDKNRDGKLNRREVQGLVLPHYDHFDTDRDGLLDANELQAVSDWLNHHHEPGARKVDKAPK